MRVRVCRCVLRVRPCTPVLRGAPACLQKISRVTSRAPGGHSTACDKHGLLNINRVLRNALECPQTPDTRGELVWEPQSCWTFT